MEGHIDCYLVKKKIREKKNDHVCIFCSPMWIWSCWPHSELGWYLRERGRESYPFSTWWEGFRPTLRSPIAIPKNRPRVPFSTHNPPQTTSDKCLYKHSFWNLDIKESIIYQAARPKHVSYELIQRWIHQLPNVEIAKFWDVAINEPKMWFPILEYFTRGGWDYKTCLESGLWVTSRELTCIWVWQTFCVQEVTYEEGVA